MQILFRPQTATAGTEKPDTGIGNRHQFELGERIVERYVDHRAAVGIERDARIPEQKGVEQFTRRCTPATATGRHGLFAVVPLADDLRLRRRRFDLIGTFGQHRIEQFPTFVRAQFQQRLIDGREGDFGAGRYRFAVRLRHLHPHLRRFARPVVGLLRRHLDLELESVDADIDGRQTELVRRLGEIDHCRRLRRIPPFPEPGQRLAPAPAEERVPLERLDAAAYGEYRDEGVRPPLTLHRQLNDRLEARQRHDPRINDATGLDRNQRRCLAERCAHLQARRLAGRVAALLGNHVDAILVAGRKPQITRPGDPVTGAGIGDIARLVARFGKQIDVARLTRLRRTHQLAARIALTLANLAEILEFGVMLVGVETANDALAMTVVDTALAHDLDGRLGHRFALHVEHHHLDRAGFLDRRPILDGDAGNDSGRREFNAAVDRLDFAVGIGKAHLGVKFARPLDFFRQGHCEFAGAGVVERQRLLVRNQQFPLATVIDGEGSAPLLVEIDNEMEAVIALVLGPTRAQRRRHFDLGALGRAAVEER